MTGCDSPFRVHFRRCWTRVGSTVLRASDNPSYPTHPPPPPGSYFFIRRTVEVGNYSWKLCTNLQRQYLLFLFFSYSFVSWFDFMIMHHVEYNSGMPSWFQRLLAQSHGRGEKQEIARTKCNGELSTTCC